MRLRYAATSAYGYTQTFPGVGQRVRFAPKTGHSNADVGFQADFVCFTPESGPSSGGSQESGFDPKRTFEV